MKYKTTYWYFVLLKDGKLKGKKGYVRYVGKVVAKTGIFVGIELDAPDGKHNGTVKGKRYFKCRDRYGYMAPHETFELFGKSKNKKSKRLVVNLYHYNK